jgi:hypothetical protein
LLACGELDPAGAALGGYPRGIGQADDGLGGADWSDAAPVGQTGNEVIDDCL